MSYEILYQKCYIKLEDNLFVPMVEMGSNNCYENSGRNAKRARSWQNLTWVTGGKVMCTKEDIETQIDSERQELIKTTSTREKEEDRYTDEMYGYFTSISMYGKRCSTTTFQEYRSFFVNGCNSAVTVETLLENHITVNVHAYAWDSEKTEKETGKKILKVYPKTSHELKQELQNFTEYYQGTGIMFWVGLDIWGDELKRMRRKINPKVKKEKKAMQVNEIYVLGNHLGYFNRKLKRGYKYSYYLCSSTKKFLTEKKAQSFLSKLGLDFEVKKIEKEMTIYR